MNIARLVGNIFIYNKTQSDDWEVHWSLGFGNETAGGGGGGNTYNTYNTYEAKDTYVLGSWVKMQMQNASTAGLNMKSAFQ